MKRTHQNAHIAGRREKQARPDNGAGGSSSGNATHGSSVQVRPQPVLGLYGDDIDMTDSRDEHNEDSRTEDENDSDEEEEADRLFGDLVAYESLLTALNSKKASVRIKATKLLLNRLADLSTSERIRLLEIARKNVYTESDKGAKILLIQVLQGTLEGTPVDGRSVVEDLLSQLQADSTEIRVQVYDTISYIIKMGRLPQDNLSNINTMRALLTTSIVELKDRHHRIRSAALHLISQLAPQLRLPTLSGNAERGSHKGYSQHDIQVILSNYVTDPEPRVRKNALKALLELHNHGFKLGIVMYDAAILSLVDDYQEVRLVGLDLIFIISRLYPNQYVQSPAETWVHANRLVDDAFIRVCDMVNDSSMVVRAKACSYLGRFRSVDYKFLSQTFSKQIMARLKVDQAPKNLAAGPAQKQAQRAKLIATPEGDQDVTAQQIRLLDSGACGAFVHGLEDEYQDVRNAAINSICELCLHNPEFSVLALDYLVDMFMDEIDYVRLNALTSLYKIGTKVPLAFDTEQLQIALGVLEDADRDVRESTHRMLRVITMSTADGMNSFLESIASNMRRFPEDQISLYQCIKAVGRRHGSFVESLVPEMLSLNKMYLPIEENVDDMHYGGHLILIFNAAIPNPKILQMLPKYSFKHYTYLRDKYPNCFPEPNEIPCLGTQPLRDLASALTMTIAADTSSDMDVDNMALSNVASSAYETTIAAMRVQTEEDAESFYERALQNLDRLHALSRKSRSGDPRDSQARNVRFGFNSTHRTILSQQIMVCQRDLRYIVDVHSKQGRNAEFASMYLECCDLLLQIQESYQSPSFIMLAPVLSAQLYRLSYYMDHNFMGLDPATKVGVSYFRVLANLVWFFGMTQKKSTTLQGDGVFSFENEGLAAMPAAPSNQSNQALTREYLQSMLQHAIKRVTDLQQQMDQPDINQQQVGIHRAYLGDLRMALVRAFNSPTSLEIVKLMSNLACFVPMEIDFRKLDLRRVSAQVTRPTLNRDVPLDIHPTFPFMIPVEGMIHHLRDTRGIAVQVTFPGDIIRHYYPPADHFTAIDEDTNDDFKDDSDNEGDNEMEANIVGLREVEKRIKKESGEAEEETESTGARGTSDRQSREGSSSGVNITTPRTRTYRLRTLIEVYPEASWGTSTPTPLRITLSRAFQPDLVGHDEFICRFAEEIAHQGRHLDTSEQQQSQVLPQHQRQHQRHQRQQDGLLLQNHLQHRSKNQGRGNAQDQRRSYLAEGLQQSAAISLLAMERHLAADAATRRTISGSGTGGETEAGNSSTQQTQSTLEISRSVTFFVSRRAVFEV